MKISKSKFVAGVQCLKRLYWLVHERGHEVVTLSIDLGQEMYLEPLGELALEIGASAVSAPHLANVAFHQERQVRMKPDLSGVVCTARLRPATARVRIVTRRSRSISARARSSSSRPTLSAGGGGGSRRSGGAGG